MLFNIIFICGNKYFFDYRDVMINYRIVYVGTYRSYSQ
jgi:hypothetical protein